VAATVCKRITPWGYNDRLVTTLPTPARAAEGPQADDAPTAGASPLGLAGRGAGPSAPPPEPSSAAGTSSSHGSASPKTVRETLFAEEIARTRIFALVAGVFAIFLGATLPLLGGDRTAKRVLAGLLLVMAISCALFVRALRRDEGYTTARAIAFTYVCTLTAFAGIWYFGIFSAAVAIIPFGIAFFGLGQSSGTVFVAYSFCAGLYAALAGIVLTNVVPDTGIARVPGLDATAKFIVVALIEGIFFATFWLQRRTRATTLAALEQHDRTVRALSQRDALLREAKGELAHAIQAGGVGHWSDATVGGYKLGRVIGRGAVGEVYEAVRTVDGEPAAVKLLHPQVLRQAAVVERFLREARIVASLDVPSVVRVLDVSPADAEVPFLAMERLSGIDLSDYLREHRRMGVRGVLSMVRQVGLGLDAAHAAGIVHRDLKPRNLFLSRQGEREMWKILDFGVARAQGEETITSRQVVGTPNYMAPEQANGREVSHRTDLFALGVIAYRALTGHPAFDGETTAEILYKVVHRMPLRPSAAAPLPPDIDLALAVAMAKDPVDRFASPAELVRALEQASHGQLDSAIRMRAEVLVARFPWTAAPE
jgi:eukaryotic-like serine/threonine-protein kinase